MEAMSRGKKWREATEGSAEEGKGNSTHKVKQNTFHPQIIKATWEQ